MRRKKFFAILICISLILGMGSAVAFADPVELTKVEAKAAACTEDGNPEYWVCSG